MNAGLLYVVIAIGLYSVAVSIVLTTADDINSYESDPVNCTVFDENETECCSTNNCIYCNKVSENAVGKCLPWNVTSECNDTVDTCKGVVTSITATATNPTSIEISSETVITSSDSTRVTTETSVAPSSTSNHTDPTTGPTTQSVSCPKGFDAASFFGGIVLGLGVCGIVFFLYKWYRARNPASAPYQNF